MAAALADDSRNVFLAAFEFVGERVIALRLLHRVEVFALDIFNDRDFERIRIADVDRYDRNFVQPRGLRRPPAAFAGDDLEPILRAAHRPNYDRLNHSVLLDRIGEFLQLGIGKFPAWIARIRFEELDRHLALRARPVDMRGFTADIPDQ